MMTVVVIASDKQTACKSLRLLSREIASKSSVENINAVHNLYCMLCCWLVLMVVCLTQSETIYSLEPI